MSDKEDRSVQAIAYETRFVPLTTADPDTVVRYVSASLQVLGGGSAIPVQGGAAMRGIQLTLPVNLIHNLEAVIASYDRGELAAPPAVLEIIPVSNAGKVLRMLRELRLCPEDLDVTSESDNSLKLIVSGAPSRREFVRTVLKIHIDKISNL